MLVSESKNIELGSLSDAQLLRGLERLVVSGRELTAELVRHLAEVEERRLHLKAGFGSLFSYCLMRWKMSEDEACRRIEVARLGRRFPVLCELLASGKITLTVAALLKPYLNDANRDDLLSAVANLSVRAAREVLAARFPQPDVPAVVRKLPDRRAPVGAARGDAFDTRMPHETPIHPRGTLPIGFESEPHESTTPSNAPSHPRHVTSLGPVLNSHAGGSSPSKAAALISQRATRSDLEGTLLGLASEISAQSSRVLGFATQTSPARSTSFLNSSRQRSQIEPLSEARYRVQFTATAEVKEKLELARDLLRHRNPTGDLIVIIDRALDLLIAELEKNRFGAASRPRQDTKLESHRVSRSARRAVVARDGLSCSFTDWQGSRCGARAFLEYDHRHPRGKGGSSTVANLRLLCRAHNQLAAELEYGRDTIKSAIRNRRIQRSIREPACTAIPAEHSVGGEPAVSAEPAVDGASSTDTIYPR